MVPGSKTVTRRHLLSLLPVVLALLLLLTLHRQDALPTAATLASLTTPTYTRPASSSPHTPGQHYALASLFNLAQLSAYSPHPPSSAHSPPSSANATIHSLYRSHKTCRNPTTPDLSALRNATEHFCAPSQLAFPHRLALHTSTLVVFLDARNDSALDSILPTLTALHSQYAFRCMLLLDTAHRSVITPPGYLASLQNHSLPLRWAPSQGTDLDLYVARQAHHLLPFGEDFAALAALATKATVHLVSSFHLTADASLVNLITNPSPFPPSNGTRLASLIGPTTPTCCRLRRYSVNDTDPCTVCDNLPQLSHPPCWILSAGAHPRYHFEREMNKLARCKIHVFTCPDTKPFSAPKKLTKSLKKRISTHPLCLRSEGDGNGTVSWKQALAIGGGKKLSPPVVVRLDDHGYEVEMVKAITILPKEMLPIEVVLMLRVGAKIDVGGLYEKRESGMSMGEMGVMKVVEWLMLAGYRLVYQTAVEGCEDCRQLSLVLQDHLPV